MKTVPIEKHLKNWQTSFAHRHCGPFSIKRAPVETQKKNQLETRFDIAIKGERRTRRRHGARWRNSGAERSKRQTATRIARYATRGSCGARVTSPSGARFSRELPRFCFLRPRSRAAYRILSSSGRPATSLFQLLAALSIEMKNTR